MQFFYIDFEPAIQNTTIQNSFNQAVRATTLTHEKEFGKGWGRRATHRLCTRQWHQGTPRLSRVPGTASPEDERLAASTLLCPEHRWPWSSGQSAPKVRKIGQCNPLHKFEAHASTIAPIFLLLSVDFR